MSDNLSTLSDDALVAKIRERERELVRTRFAHSMNQLENTASLRVIRKDIARLQTEARAREVAQSRPKGSLLQLTAKKEAAPEATTTPAAAPEKGGFLKGIVDKLTNKE